MKPSSTAEKARLKRKAMMFSQGKIGTAPRSLYRDGTFIDGFFPSVGGKLVMWEKDFCATEEEALEEARLFQCNATRVYLELS